MVNPGNVIGGHKANLNNPNTSEESKQHSREILENQDGEEIQFNTESDEDKNPNNVAGGLKATLKNPNVSEEAKEHAKERLDRMYQ